MPQAGKPGWITVPGKGRRWWTGSEYKMERPAPPQMAGGGLIEGLGRLYRQADRAMGGVLPGGGTGNVASPLVRRAASAGLNQLPDRVNLFGRYVSGIGNEGLELDASTKASLRRASEQQPRAQRPMDPRLRDFMVNRGVPPSEIAPTVSVEAVGPGRPESGPVNPYRPQDAMEGLGYGKDVTNTLGRFTAQVKPDGAVRVMDTYDMVNEAEDPRLLDGQFRPKEAWETMKSIWEPGMPPGPVRSGRGYNARPQGGDSPVFSPATQAARALLYALPYKPQPYEIDITIPRP